MFSGPLFGVFLGIYALIGITILYIAICGQSEFHRAGLIGRMHRFFTHELPAKLGDLISHYCGSKGNKLLGDMTEYCCMRPNPLLQLFYLAIVFGSYFCFNIYVAPLVPTIHPAPFQPLHLYLVHAGVAVTIACFAFVSWSDPGVVNADNQKRISAAYHADGVLYPTKPKICKVCKVARPARTKHCYICNKCISKLDHHCPWVNNCIGELNMRWFLLFLICTGIICTYGGVLCGMTCLGWLRAQGLMAPGIQYRTSTGSLAPVTWQIRVGYLIAKTGLVAPLGVFLLMICLVVWAFTAFQIWHIFTAVTTAESFKYPQLRKERKLSGDNTPITNAYNRGLLWNLLVVLFPPSLYPRLHQGHAKQS